MPERGASRPRTRARNGRSWHLTQRSWLIIDVASVIFAAVATYVLIIIAG